MKKGGINWFIGVLLFSSFFVFALSCTQTKQLQVIGGNETEGVIHMEFECKGVEKPKVQWDQADRDAFQQCKDWGYSGAEPFDSGTSRCLKYNRFGCVSWRVIYTCRCTNEHSDSQN